MANVDVKSSLNVFQFSKIEPVGNIRLGENSPIPRSGHRCVTDGANLYSFGGYNPNVSTRQNSGPLFRELWRFNFSTKCWTKVETTGPAPHQLASHAALLTGNHLLVYGGTGIPFGNASSNSLYACDLTMFTWKEIVTSGELPSKLYGQAMVLVGTNLYVYGGTTGFEYTSDVHCVDLSTKIWREMKSKNPKPTESDICRYRHEMACDGKYLYVFGGGMATENFGFDTIPAFDIESNEWTFIRSSPDLEHDLDKRDEVNRNANLNRHSPGVPCARKYHSLVQRGDDVFICGGYNDKFVFPDVWKVNLPTMQWRRLPCQLPVPVFFHAATITEAGCMYVFGGVTHVDQKSRSNDVYKVWLTVPTLKELIWSVVTDFVKDVSSVPRSSWLQMGVPSDLVNRIDHKANFG